MYTGEIHDHWDDNKKPRSIAILSHGKPDFEHDIEKPGYTKKHDFYYDTGMGHKPGDGQMKITGHVHIHADGKTTYHGDADPEKSHNLLVYK